MQGPLAWPLACLSLAWHCQGPDLYSKDSRTLRCKAHWPGLWPASLWLGTAKVRICTPKILELYDARPTGLASGLPLSGLALPRSGSVLQRFSNSTMQGPLAWPLACLSLAWHCQGPD